MAAPLVGLAALGSVVRAGSTAAGVGGNISKTIQNNIPQLEDEAIVEVQGQPGSNKQQLYFLALAAANGLVSRHGNSLLSINGSMGMILIEYDGADDWVRCTIRYRFGMASLNVDNPRFKRDNLAVYRGPACDVVGGSFDFIEDTLLPGIPSSSRPNDVPVLPFAHEMILTPCPTTPEPRPVAITQNPAPTPTLSAGTGRNILSPNPKPPGDNRSRGSVIISSQQDSLANSGGTISPGSAVSSSRNSDPKKCCEKILALIPLVYAALSAPATNSLMMFDGPVSGPNGG